ncbi:molecular chaperone DnaJ [Alphaproteobacteria bacterium]|nr:molecular chaperone DnaJ [Alphaproteobacteria bacterium]
MSNKDLYALLGVSKGSSADELKKAYRKQAMKYHPDRNPGDDVAERKFKEIGQAYEILKDDQKRAAYDQYGSAAFDGTGNTRGGGGAGHSAGGFGNFSDIFEEMFSDFGASPRQGASAAQRGADLRYDLEISLLEAFSGLTKTVTISSQSSCNGCHGSGAAKGSQPSMCSTCGGRGRVRAQQGFFTVERACHVCHGMGQTITNPCGDCRGAGRQRQERQLKVSIPAGIEDGTRIRLSGEGEAGLRGGPQGDLYVFLSISSHDFFKRKGHMITCTVPIPMTTAALGGSVDVPTIDGKKAIIKVPAGTQSGKEFRLKSKGMPVMRQASRGDMYVQVHMETPVNLSGKQKELLQQFAEASAGKKHHPQSHGFFDKIKSLFSSILPFLAGLWPFGA